MEKFVICSFLFLLVLLSACTNSSKNAVTDDNLYQKGWTWVWGIRGTDTSSSKMVNGRIETTALASDEDSQLKAELIGYMPLPAGQGQYIIKITNKTSCQMILRWNWENLNPVSSIEPTDSTAMTNSSDIINGNSIKTYTMIAMAVPGKIFVKAEKFGGSCTPSKQLILVITPAILPIEFTDIKTAREKDIVTATWHTEAPQDVDYFQIMWTPTGDKKDGVSKGIIDSDKKTKDWTFKYTATKKDTK